MKYTTSDFLNDIRNSMSGTETSETEAQTEPTTEETTEETAEPVKAAEPETGEGEKEQAPAEPAEEKAERARQAAARREREKQQAVEKALSEERGRNDDRLKRMMELAGWKNAEGKTIETVDELDSYLEELENRRFQKELSEGKLKREDLQRLVAGELAKQTEQKPEEPEQAEDGFAQTAEEELRQIAEIDPAMTDLQTILDSENGEEFERLVMEHGHSFLDAFKIANAGKLAEAKQRKAAEAAVQEAYNASRSKDHMTPMKSHGEGAASVPPDVRAMYRRFNKGISDEEIRKDWQKRQKGT